jgi:hypothetical protein
MRWTVVVLAGLGLLTWRSGDVKHATDAVVQALASLTP